MKKLLLLTIAFTVINLINAQAPRIGFTAGTAISNYTMKSDGSSETEDAKIGLTAGILVDLPVGKKFSFQPALNFLQKGTKSEESGAKATLNINSIEVPLNLLYNLSGNIGTFFIGAGPSFSYGISGKLKYKDETDSYEEDIKFGTDDEDMLKGMDIGANFLTGFRFPNGLFIAANYTAGLNNLSPGETADGTLKSNYFGIKLGWLLNGKNK